MDLVKAFDNKEDFPTRFPDIDEFYKDGIEILIKKQFGLSKDLHELPIDATDPSIMKMNKFEIKGLFVI